MRPEQRTWNRLKPNYSDIIVRYGKKQQIRLWERLGNNYLIGQIIEMDHVTHHPNRFVERAEFVISVTEHQK